MKKILVAIALVCSLAGLSSPSGAWLLPFQNVSTIPAAPAITSGTPNANSTVSLAGTAVNNSTVAVYDGAGFLGNTTANGSGAWSFTSGGLIAGNYSFTATATTAGGTSNPSSPYAVTVQIPSAPVITSGLVNGNNSVTIGGTSVANATITPTYGSGPLGTTTANGSGTWSFTTQVLSVGTYLFTATQTTAAGTSGQSSPPYSVTVSGPVTGCAYSSTASVDGCANAPTSAPQTVTNGVTYGYCSTTTNTIPCQRQQANFFTGWANVSADNSSSPVGSYGQGVGGAVGQFSLSYLAQGTTPRSAYPSRPLWNVAGVEYPVGVDYGSYGNSSNPLKNPIDYALAHGNRITSGTGPGTYCTYGTTGCTFCNLVVENAVPVANGGATLYGIDCPSEAFQRSDATTLNLSGWDFSGNSGTHQQPGGIFLSVEFGGNSSHSCTISSNVFGSSAAGQAAGGVDPYVYASQLSAQGGCVNAVVSNNFFDQHSDSYFNHGGPQVDFESIVTWTGQYNYFGRGQIRPLTLQNVYTGCNQNITIKYNFLESHTYNYTQAHPDTIFTQCNTGVGVEHFTYLYDTNLQAGPLGGGYTLGLAGVFPTFSNPTFGIYPTIENSIFATGITHINLQGYTYSALQFTSLTGGGSGYAVGDTLTLTPTNSTNAVVVTPAMIKVTGVSSGAITSFDIINEGAYAVDGSTSFTQSTTSGSGSGATFGSPTWYGWMVVTTTPPIPNSYAGDSVWTNDASANRVNGTYRQIGANNIQGHSYGFEGFYALTSTVPSNYTQDATFTGSSATFGSANIIYNQSGEIINGASLMFLSSATSNGTPYFGDSIYTSGATVVNSSGKPVQIMACPSGAYGCGNATQSATFSGATWAGSSFTIAGTASGIGTGNLLVSGSGVVVDAAGFPVTVTACPGSCGSAGTYTLSAPPSSSPGSGTITAESSYYLVSGIPNPALTGATTYSTGYFQPASKIIGSGGYPDTFVGQTSGAVVKGFVQSVYNCPTSYCFTLTQGDPSTPLQPGEVITDMASGFGYVPSSAGVRISSDFRGLGTQTLYGGRAQYFFPNNAVDAIGSSGSPVNIYDIHGGGGSVYFYSGPGMLTILGSYSWSKTPLASPITVDSTFTSCGGVNTYNVSRGAFEISASCPLSSDFNDGDALYYGGAFVVDSSGNPVLLFHDSGFPPGSTYGEIGANEPSTGPTLLPGTYSVVNFNYRVDYTNSANPQAAFTFTGYAQGVIPPGAQVVVGGYQGEFIYNVLSSPAPTSNSFSLNIPSSVVNKGGVGPGVLEVISPYDYPSSNPLAQSPYQSAGLQNLTIQNNWFDTSGSQGCYGYDAASLFGTTTQGPDYMLTLPNGSNVAIGAPTVGLSAPICQGTGGSL